MGVLDEQEPEAGRAAGGAREADETSAVVGATEPVKAPPLAEPLGSDPLDAPTPGPYTAGPSDVESA